MIRNALFSVLLLLGMSWPAWGDIVLSLSDGTVDAGGGSFAATVQLTETSYDIYSYELDIKLTPIGDAVIGGVSFPDTNPAASTLSGPNGYIFTETPIVYWQTRNSTGDQIYGDSASDYLETVAVGTYDLITAQLELTGADVGDQYQVEFLLDTGLGDTEFWLKIGDDTWQRASLSGDLVWSDTGTITVTGGVIPEPGSITMLVGLAVTSLVLYRRRRKR